MTDVAGAADGFHPALLVGVALVLAGCAGGATAPAGGAVPALAGTYWALQEVEGNSFPDYRGTREPYIVFRLEGGVTGFAGCNTMGGAYETSGDRLRVGPLAMTRMACVGTDAMVMESAFTRALDETASYRIDGRTLELRDAGGKLRSRLEARGAAAR